MGGQGIFDRVYWAADKLVDNGYTTIHVRRLAVFCMRIRRRRKQDDADNAWGGAAYSAPVEMMWEYTTSPPSVNVCKGGLTNADEVHGPFPTSQMTEWNRLGYFDAADLWLRRVGQEWIFKRSVSLEELFAVDNPDNLPG